MVINTISNTTTTHSCNCIGPQNGQPLCPCQMRGVGIINGRYVKKVDLGPVIEKTYLYRSETNSIEETDKSNIQNKDNRFGNGFINE